MDYLDCRILVELARDRNMTHAAQTLFLSQPALTRRIKNLEREFGVPLVIRRSKGIAFTERGDRLLDAARKMLMDYEVLKSDLAAFQEGRVSGELRIGAIYVLLESVLPPLIASFASRCPEVAFQLVAQPNVKLFHGRRVHLGSEPMYVVSKEPIDLADLPMLPRIDAVRNAKLNALLDAWWNERYRHPPRSLVRVSNSNIGLKLVSLGMGYAFVSESSLANFGSGLFRTPMYDGRGQPVLRHTFLYYRNEVLRLRQAAAFLDFIEKTGLPPPSGAGGDRDEPPGSLTGPGRGV
ncbi:LysR family transcriptional regulator [Fretibacterium sp. OH1220_COT-178]|uniref:LysR family transcriptional regulator n=1 Tax=Fretibacterium sp. OH1220_COT-178 TaxID=2491047 RepID=UPI000F5EE197|nr:LysR family transcriptional regulator [Fretibacterium sp. OH1220_COT-178]RRD65017.1 LysR family transcriptional regulator [Fretibacterium sp. OH1220_COT-178]